MAARCESCARVTKTEEEKTVTFGFGTYKEILLSCSTLEFDGKRPTLKGLDQCCDYFSSIGDVNPLPIAWEGPPQVITESKSDEKRAKK